MRRRGKVYGISTGPPEPQAIDPASGFKVPLSNLRKQWDGELVDYRFIDRRNPQDFVRGVNDRMDLPYSRPQQPATFIAMPLHWEKGLPMIDENGDPIYEEGGILPVEL